MDFFSGKKITVPGGNGFLGTYITKILSEKGASVFVPKHSKGWDFTKREDCARLFRQDNFDMVINCAAFQGGIGFHRGRENDIFYNNLLMGTFLLQGAQRAGVKKFVNIVAGCAYPGYLEKDELNEEDFWNGPVHDSIMSYGYARKTSVIQGMTLRKQHNFNSIHLILANMYGPGEHFNPQQSKALAGLIKKFYDAKKSKLPEVEVWGTGKPVRDWLYVRDGADGILRAAEVYNDIEPLNIASGFGISISDLAQLIKNIIGFEGKTVYNTEKPDGALKKIFGVRKMKEKLSWLPVTTLEQGIKETVAWLDKNYEHAVSH
jgi:GDP-L-fucose synthase